MAKSGGGKGGGKNGKFGQSNAGAGKDKLGGKITLAGPGASLHSVAKGGK